MLLKFDFGPYERLKRHMKRVEAETNNVLRWLVLEELCREREGGARVWCKPDTEKGIT